MRFQTRRLVCSGLALVASGALAAGAAASQHRGPSALKVDATGAVSAFSAATATTAGSVALTVGDATLTCAIRPGASATATVGATVRLKCRDIGGVLTATKLRSRVGSSEDGHRGKSSMDRRHSSSGKAHVTARGTVSAIAVDVAGMPTSITVDPGFAGRTDTLPAVTCAVSSRTEVAGSPAVGDTVKISCRSRRGVLSANEITVRTATMVTPPPAGGAVADDSPERETKGRITALGGSSITVGAVTCDVPATVPTTGFSTGDLVEIRCAGTPLTLTKIEHED